MLSRISERERTRARSAPRYADFGRSRPGGTEPVLVGVGDPSMAGGDAGYTAQPDYSAAMSRTAQIIGVMFELAQCQPEDLIGCVIGLLDSPCLAIPGCAAERRLWTA
jgi:hypothetical protein